MANYPEDFDHLCISVNDINQFNLLSEAEQTAFCLNILEAQVNNGGFNQFFSNSSGYFALETLVALERIGATKTKQVLNQALSIAYPGGFPSEKDLHEEYLSEDDDSYDALNELDHLFFDYEDDLSALVNEYLKNYG